MCQALRYSIIPISLWRRRFDAVRWYLVLVELLIQFHQVEGVLVGGHGGGEGLFHFVSMDIVRHDEVAPDLIPPTVVDGSRI